jgi:transcriptional regulator with XRE-family HTH domain
MAKALPEYRDHPELAAIGRAIREMRLAKGLSQEALADLAEIDRSYMGGIERGQHNVAMINLLKIAGALGATLRELAARAEL